ncbi:FAD-dependent monooxygenase [Nitrospirillum iridis]|uniref:Flavin-dependent dehydrogenase n=1 Tax=Nitrospirillum iridis TaxID=765888 RepID=A0A7X0ECV8_9PROT|nr:FAD-dependent monooxygenase [Nitrospirillum iridis]MBB6251490.1 flavin-dependent dehydrogenase [Nitrospirillum iridis]
MRARYDAVILGGGPAGLATALSLRRQCPDAAILVAEAGPAERQGVGDTAPPDLLLPLGQLGLVARFRADGHAPCPGSASLWGGGRVTHDDFLTHPVGPAWRLDRGRFDAMLVDAALSADVRVAFDTRFLRAEPMPGLGHRLMMETAGGVKPVETPWVVDATGVEARFARALGVGRRVDDTLHALLAFLPVSGNLTWQTLLEATAGGWWYAARLPDGRAAAMLVTDGAGLRALRTDAGTRSTQAAGEAAARMGGAWRRALAATLHVGPRLAEAGVVLAPSLKDGGDGPMLLPIQTGVLAQVEGAGWLAVGDAAASYDPGAARGVHKALVDGVDAGRDVARALGASLPPRPSPRAAVVAERHADHCRNRARLYGLETRWPDAPFWRERRRRAALALAAIGVVPPVA